MRTRLSLFCLRPRAVSRPGCHYLYILFFPMENIPAATYCVSSLCPKHRNYLVPVLSSLPVHCLPVRTTEQQASHSEPGLASFPLLPHACKILNNAREDKPMLKTGVH